MVYISQKQLEQRWDEAPDEIRDAVFSDIDNSVLDSVSKSYSLDEEKQKDLAYLCLLVFLGFITTKELYNQLLEFFEGNTKNAYDVYTVLDQKLFSPVRQIVNAFYKAHWTPAQIVENASTAIEEPKLEERVNLKKSPVEQVQAVNLKTEPIEKIPSSPGPVIIKVANQQETPKPPQSTSFSQQSAPLKPVSRAELFSPHTFHTRYDASSQKQEVPAQVVQVDKKKNEQTPSVADTGPVILHQKEDSIPVAQMAKFKEYKNASPGGFLGSFGSLFSRKQDVIQTPRVSVEMPPPVSIPNGIPQKEDTAQDVAVRVKDFGKKQAPPLQYKDYRAYLDSRDEQ